MKLRKWWAANFLVLEFWASVALSIIFVIWSEVIDKGHFVSMVFFGSREVLYGALATIFGSMLGFSITAASIVLGYSTSEKLSIVKQSKHYQDLWNVFKSSMRILAFATIISLVGLVFDKDNNPVNFFLYLNLFAVAISFFRIARCIWVLGNIINIVTKP